MFTTILLKYWKHIAVIVAIVILATVGYNKIYAIGYNEGIIEANTACAERMDKYKEDLAKRIQDLETTSSKLADKNDAAMSKLKSDYTKILSSINGKPLYVVEQGACKPSPEAVTAINEAVEKANLK